MHLVHLLLPTADNSGQPFPPELFGGLRRELTDRFGGATVFSRSPADGFWRSEEGTSHDEIVVFEVMCEVLDESWWRERRKRLEQAFRQDEIVIRIQEIRLL